MFTSQPNRKTMNSTIKHLPSKPLVMEFSKMLIFKLFPYIDGGKAIKVSDKKIRRQLRRLLKPMKEQFTFSVEQIEKGFLDSLPIIHSALKADADFINANDPAATSTDEVVMTYPGFYAIMVYRLANRLLTMGIPLIPRIMTEHAHSTTGIDIHPGASIGNQFFIDHGTGIVIGETSQIGNRVKLYQGVTIGALSVCKESTQTKRHPTIEDDVVIYAGATILGGRTTIGHDSIIGGNVWLTSSVPPYSTVQHEDRVKVKQKKYSLN